MKVIRIYSWNPRSLRPGQVRNPLSRLKWSIGNFGDLFNFDLVRHLYGIEGRNSFRSRKILLVGSTLHRANHGDLVSGVGAKGPERQINCLPEDIVGLRGELSLMAVEKKIGNLKKLRFLGDPGAIASDVYAGNEIPKRTHGTTLIPHYTDFAKWKQMGFPAEQMVSPDNEPRTVYDRIASSEAVVTSSLHGLVFANSAGVPVTLVRPASEPFFKFEDYLTTLSGDRPEILSEDHALRNLNKLVGAVGAVDKKALRIGLPSKGEIASFLEESR